MSSRKPPRFDDSGGTRPKVVLEPGDEPGHTLVTIFEFHSDAEPVIKLDLDRDAAEALAGALARFSRADA